MDDLIVLSYIYNCREIKRIRTYGECTIKNMRILEVNRNSGIINKKFVGTIVVKYLSGSCDEYNIESDVSIGKEIVTVKSKYDAKTYFIDIQGNLTGESQKNEKNDTFDEFIQYKKCLSSYLVHSTNYEVEEEIIKLPLMYNLLYGIPIGQEFKWIDVGKEKVFPSNVVNRYRQAVKRKEFYRD